MAASVTNSGEANSKVIGATLETAAFACSGSNRLAYAVALCSSGAPDERAVVKRGGSSGVKMTRIRGSLTIGTFNKCSLYRLVAPSTSSETTHATWPNDHDERALISCGVQDAHQTQPDGDITTNTGTSTGPTGTANTDSGELVLGAVTWQDGGLDTTITAGQSSIQEIEGTENTYNGLLLEYTSAGGATQAMTATLSNSVDWGVFAWQVNPYAADSAPLVQASDVTESGSNTAQASWAVSYPAYVNGTLLCFHVASDANVTHDWPATGPNGETINTIQDSLGDTTTANQRVSGFWFVGSATTGAGTLTVTPSASEQWCAAVLKVAAGTFNSTTPIQTNVGTAQDSTADTSWATPAWTSDATANGRIICFAGHDTVTTTTLPNGWGELAATDIGVVGLTLTYREAPNSSSESIASVNFGKVSETDCSFGYVINAPSTGVNTKQIDDTLTISESVVKQAYQNRVVSDALTLTETITALLLGSGVTNVKQINDALTLTETVASIAYHYRVTVDALELFDEPVFREIVLGINDATTVTDSTDRFPVRGRLHSDSVTVSELVTRAYYANRLIDDTLTITETLAKSALFSRRIEDAAELAELLSAVYVPGGGGGGGTINTKVIDDTVAMIDTMLKVARFTRQSDEAIVVTDAMLSQAFRNAIITNQVTASDTLSTYAERGRVFSDVLSLFDSQANYAERGRVAVDSLDISDALMRTLYYNRLIDDAVSMVDALVALYVSGDASLYDVRPIVGIDRSAQAVIGWTQSGMPVIWSNRFAMPILGGYSS